MAHGDRLGPYRLEGILGQGGMGTVYRAIDERLGRPVALKVIRLDGAARAHVSVDALRREARLAATLSHPSLVTIFSYEEVGTNALIAMELAPGQPLLARLGTPWPWRSAARVLLGVARGVGAAHAAGVVHLDLKPANVMVTDAGDVKVLDFGVARPMREVAGGNGLALGTVGYMAPEQLRGQSVGPWSDVFALGVLGFELLTGSRPFGKGGSSEIAHRVLAEEPPGMESAERARQRCGPLGPIIRRALQKRPEERYTDAQSMALALEAMLEGAHDSGWVYQPTGPVSAPQPTFQAPQEAPVSLGVHTTGSPLSRRTLAVGGVAALLLLVASAGLNAFLSTPSRTVLEGGSSRGFDAAAPAAPDDLEHTAGTPVPPPLPAPPAAEPPPVVTQSTGSSSSGVAPGGRPLNLSAPNSQVRTPVAPPPPSSGSVSGQVSWDGGPLPARVVLVGTNQVTMTDTQGYYQFQVVTPGEHRVRAELVGNTDLVAAPTITETVRVVPGVTEGRDFRFARAVGGIAGRVSGGQARIVVAGTSQVTTTSGVFRFDDLPVGQVTLLVTWVSDPTRTTQRVVKVARGQVASVDLSAPTTVVAVATPPPPPPLAAPPTPPSADDLHQLVLSQWEALVRRVANQDFQGFLNGSRFKGHENPRITATSSHDNGNRGGVTLHVEFSVPGFTGGMDRRTGTFHVDAEVNGGAWRVREVRLERKFW